MRAVRQFIWLIPLWLRRTLLLTISVVAAYLSGEAFLPYLVKGEADGITAVLAIVFILLNTFGTACLLLWLAGFFGMEPSCAEEYHGGVLRSRTAYVMPIYHEDVERVKVGVRQMWISAKVARLTDFCDFYILSDSTTASIRREEDLAYEALLEIFDHNRSDSGRLFLIRRPDRINYKAGNVMNFIQSHGGAYEFMIILDADSVMLGGCVRRLIRRMENSPNTAVLQSLMSAVRSATPFARAMQFGLNRLVPLYTSGLKWVLGGEAVYWGHNAIIRIAPFAKHANLPLYPGNPPFGGRVLSQDVHEACQLGRAGWDVEFDLGEGGSFEEIPGNIISYGQRDQRWCQGDYLNCAMVFSRGIKTGQRIWLTFIVSSYALSGLIILMMLLGFKQAVERETHFGAILTWSLFLNIPIVQLLPKLLAAGRNFDRHKSWVKQSLTLACDIAAGYLIGSLMMYQHLTFVVGIWMGKSIQWKSPSRDPNDKLSWKSASRVFLIPTILSLVWIVLAMILSPHFVIYGAPVLVPWVLSIPLAVWTSDSRIGDWLATRGIFRCQLSPEENLELGSLRLEADIERPTVARAVRLEAIEGDYSK